MSVRIAVAAQSFDSEFQGAVRAELAKALRPGQALVECAVARWTDLEYVRSRLVGLLEPGARPVALVGICLRPDAATVARFQAAGVPIVLVDERAEGASTVASDNVTGGYLAGRHLVEKGRRSIAVVSGPIRDYNAMQRLRGLSKALSEAGLPLPPERLVEAPGYSYRDGVAALGTLLERAGAIDAIACTAGDVCAAGLLAAARGRGVKVPDELAVIGYDDAPLAGTTEPPLTTVSQSIEALAAEALRLATEEPSAVLAKPRIVLLPPRLVPRGSA